MSSSNEIRMKLATKLIDTLSIEHIQEEQFFTSIENILESVLDNKEEIESFLAVYKERYSFSDIMVKVAEIYANHFTEDDMLDIINFYSTPTGKKWISNYTIIEKNISKVTEEYFTSLGDDIIKNIDDKF